MAEVSNRSGRDRSPEQLRAKRDEQRDRTRASLDAGLTALANRVRSGVSVADIAAASGLSERTLRRSTSRARVEEWLGRAIGTEAGAADPTVARLQQRNEKLCGQIDALRTDTADLRRTVARKDERLADLQATVDRLSFAVRATITHVNDQPA